MDWGLKYFWYICLGVVALLVGGIIGYGYGQDSGYNIGYSAKICEKCPAYDVCEKCPACNSTTCKKCKCPVASCYSNTDAGCVKCPTDAKYCKVNIYAKNALDEDVLVNYKLIAAGEYACAEKERSVELVTY